MITLPGSLSKGTPLSFSLNKSQILAAATDVWFQDANNIRRVYVIYKSTTGNQRKKLEFDFSQASPTAAATWTSRSRDNYTLNQIILEDLQGDTHSIPASAFPSGKELNFAPPAPVVYENYRPNGIVQDTLVDGSTLYIAGAFTEIRYTARNVAVISPSTSYVAKTDLGSTFPAVTGGNIMCMEYDGADTLYIGGTFTAVAGVAVKKFARLVRVSGAWTLDSSFSAAGKNQPPGAGDSVHCIKVDGDYVYVGGVWNTWLNGSSTSVTTPHYAKIVKSSGVVYWLSGMTYDVSRVTYDIQISGDELYVCGSWGMYKKNKNTGADTATLSFLNSLGASWEIRKILITANSVYIGGYFTYQANSSRNVLKLNRSTMAVDTAFVAPFTSASSSLYVRALAEGPDGNIFAGGYFNDLAATGRNIVKLNASTGARVTAFSAGSSCYAAGSTSIVNSLWVSGSSVYPIGQFNGKNAAGDAVVGINITKLDATTGAKDAAFVSNQNLVGTFAGQAEVFYGAIPYGSNLMVYGFIFGYGGYYKSGLARFTKNANGAWIIDTSFANGSISSGHAVTRMQKTGTKLYLGGSFTSIFGNARNRVAMIDTATGVVDTAFGVGVYPGGTFNGLTVAVNDMVLDGDNLYIAMNGTSATYSYKASASAYSSGNANRWLKVDRLTNIAYPFSAVSTTYPNNNIADLASDGTNLYASGLFTSWGGDSSLPGVAKLNKADGTKATGYITSWLSSGNKVRMAVIDGLVWVAGEFNDLSNAGLAVIGPAGTKQKLYTINEIGGSPYHQLTFAEFAVDGNYVYLATGHSFSGNFVYSLRRYHRFTFALDATWGIRPIGATSAALFYTMKISGDEIILGASCTNFAPSQMPAEFSSQSIIVLDKATCAVKNTI